MGLFEHFPWTDYHTLNLDWLLRTTRKLVDDVEQLKKDIIRIDGTLADHEKRITANEAAIADHEKRITANEAAIADHEKRITKNTADIERNRLAIQGLDNRLTTLETVTIPGLEDRIHNNEIDIAAAKKEISNIKTEISNIKTSISNIETRVSTLEQNFTDLSQKVENLIQNPYELPMATLGELGGVKVANKTPEQTEPVGIDPKGQLWTTPNTGGGGGSYVLPMASNTELGGVRAYNREIADTQPVGIDRDTGLLYTKPAPAPYKLPIASPSTLGGVQPEAKTDAMTTPVGVDAAGKLWASAGGGTFKSVPVTSKEGSHADTATIEVDVSSLANCSVIFIAFEYALAGNPRCSNLLFFTNKNLHKAYYSSVNSPADGWPLSPDYIGLTDSLLDMELKSKGNKPFTKCKAIALNFPD